jgi:hypothetical protein
MEEKIRDEFSKTSLSLASQRQHAKKLAQWIEHTEEKTIDVIINNPEMALKALSSVETMKQTATNRHLFISAIVAYLTHVIPDKKETLLKWKEIQKRNSEPMSEHYASNQPTEQQKDKWMEYSSILEKRDELEKGSFERLLLCFYTMMEPIRADYFSTEIVKEGSESKEENYIICSDTEARIVIRDFKTKKSHERIENVLPAELYEELKVSLTRYPRSYLFVIDDKKTPFTRKMFSNWACKTLTRVLKHAMTLTVLRHLYITEKIKAETPLEKMKEIAKKMGHTRDMQRVYGWRE